jgi:SAM-dependent methyltransferase
MVNLPSPPLSYSDQQFDLIYTFSVFTHLSEPHQSLWMNELRRVLRPGGHLLLTTCGDPYAAVLPPEAQQEYRRGRLVVLRPDASGSPGDYGACHVVHPANYVREHLATKFEVVHSVPGAGLANGEMDTYLLRRVE